MAMPQMRRENDKGGEASAILGLALNPMKLTGLNFVSPFGAV